MNKQVLQDRIKIVLSDMKAKGHIVPDEAFSIVDTLTESQLMIGHNAYIARKCIDTANLDFNTCLDNFVQQLSQTYYFDRNEILVKLSQAIEFLELHDEDH